MSEAEVQQITAEIAAARAELGETVAQLAARLDVRTRAKTKVAQTRGNVAQAVRQAPGEAQARAQLVWRERPVAVLLSGAGLAALIALLIARGRRR